MKFFVIGVDGQLGHDVMNELEKRGNEENDLLLVEQIFNCPVK